MSGMVTDMRVMAQGFDMGDCRRVATSVTIRVNVVLVALSSYLQVPAT